MDVPAENASVGLRVPVSDTLISDVVANVLIAAICFLILVFSVPAIVLNILNVLIFVKTKIDSITVCFISLALSDLISMILLSNNAIYGIIVAFRVSWGSSLPTYPFILSIAIGLSVDTSSATTTYIALQRGLCVALPFLTRHLFNKNRSLIICVSVFVFILVCSTPRAISFRLKTIPNPADNSSTVTIVQFLKTWGPSDSFYTIFVKTALVCAEFALMIVCAALIFYGMQASVKLKLKSSSQAAQAQPKGSYNTASEYSKFSNGSKGEFKKETGNGSRKTNDKDQNLKNRKETKESLVMKQSLIVVLIHVMFTTPRMLASLYGVIEPRYRVGGHYQNLYLVTYSSISVTDSINAFANFFVYLKFNSKFRGFFVNTICRSGVNVRN
ncbi:chemosensory receptor C [Elysia marginata]|uniref:Chemosensory receptor C n=1 Tax=Elysia marginata TaxID=1093978 RepID=A0AAV4EQG1_9GAST|nr:chemosensory receptor C [Elysia marginata]